MKTIEIHVPTFPKKYPVIIGQHIFSSITEYIDFDTCSSIFIITDSHVAPLYLEQLKNGLKEAIDYKDIYQFVFPAGEKNKNTETANQAYKALVEARADRQTLIINLGGGVVSDLGGYIASTYLRGIHYMTIPTTLESMVDASVGGKTGVNLGSLKNYIGVFSSPQAVLIDIETLKTLPERALLQGYAEVIKHGLIKDAHYFEMIRDKNPTSCSHTELIDIIAGSIQIKADIVQQDPHEKGIRKILNFGHTIGHVIESLSLQTEHPLFHGEAVAIGMVAEAYVSYKEGMIEHDDFEEIESTIRSAGLPTRFKTAQSIDHIVEMLYTDKKTVKGSIKWSLLEGIGKCGFNIVVNEQFAKAALEYILRT